MNKIKELAESVGGQCEYLFLSFHGAEEVHHYDLNVAKQYAEVFRKFENINTLKIEVFDDGNFTNIIKLISED